MKRTAQKGSVLLVTLVMLVVMTLVGLAGIEVTGLEEKMVLNMRDRQAAFEAAEVAMKQVEAFLGGQDGIVSGVSADDVRDVENASHMQGFFGTSDESSCDSSNPTTARAEQNWSSDCELAFSTSFQKAFNHLVEMPTFLLEEVLDDPSNPSLDVNASSDRYRYIRVTVKAKGLTDASEVRIQTIYKKYISKQSQ